MDWEEVDELIIYVCINESDNSNLNVFTVFATDNQNYIFTGEQGTHPLSWVDRQYVLNLPGETTMLIFKSDFLKVSGLISGKPYEAECLDIKQQIILHSDYLSNGIIQTMTNQEAKFEKKIIRRETND